MRTAEVELRSRLRFLQIARIEGWEVATNFAKAKNGTAEDPDLVEARKLASKNKKEREGELTPSKVKKGSKGQSPGIGKQWARGGTHQQSAAYQQTANFGMLGANVFAPPMYNLPATQPYYNQQGPATQPYYNQQGPSTQLFWPGPLTQVATQPPLPPPTRRYAQVSQPRPPSSTATGRPLICFACQQPGHIRSECPENKPAT